MFALVSLSRTKDRSTGVQSHYTGSVSEWFIKSGVVRGIFHPYTMAAPPGGLSGTKATARYGNKTLTSLTTKTATLTSDVMCIISDNTVFAIVTTFLTASSSDAVSHDSLVIDLTAQIALSARLHLKGG
ncbi:hypothetical protein J6590_024593 [Homalodisca vitripennis]|nr:hypothetical protein J6590_024593 [Homalodisca vitripennis]